MPETIDNATATTQTEVAQTIEAPTLISGSRSTLYMVIFVILVISAALYGGYWYGNKTGYDLGYSLGQIDGEVAGRQADRQTAEESSVDLFSNTGSNPFEEINYNPFQ